MEEEEMLAVQETDVKLKTKISSTASWSENVYEIHTINDINKEAERTSEVGTPIPVLNMEP
jgi:hypothetical protein